MRKIKEITKTAKISIVYPDNDGSIYTVKNLNKDLGKYLYFHTRGGIDTTGAESDLYDAQHKTAW